MATCFACMNDDLVSQWFACTRWARVDRDNVWYQPLRYCYLSL